MLVALGSICYRQSMPQRKKLKVSKKRLAHGKPAAVSPARIMEMVWDFAGPMLAEAAVQLGVFDAMDGGAATAPQIAEKTGASLRGIEALLDGLVGTGLITRRGSRFKMAPDTAAFLVHGKPTFLGGLHQHVSRQLIGTWMSLADVVRSGKPSKAVNQQQDGGEFFARFVEDIFNMSHASASAAAGALLDGKKGPISVLDIAAGSGVWGIAMAAKGSNVRVTAVDWPQVIPVTRRVTQRHGGAERFTFVEGDIHEAELGSGHQIATLGHILHSEGEARSRHLLQRVHDAMAPGGTVVIGEFVVEEGRQGPSVPLVFAVNMLVNTDAGNTFTFKQIASWLNEAGFRRPRKLAVQGPWPLILATA